MKNKRYFSKFDWKNYFDKLNCQKLKINFKQERKKKESINLLISPR